MTDGAGTGGSMAWYPVVGFLIGGGLVLADRLLTNVFAAEVVNALLIVLLVLLTRRTASGWSG